MESDGTPWRPLVHVLDICQGGRLRARGAARARPRPDPQRRATRAPTTRSARSPRSSAASSRAARSPSADAGADARSYRVSFDKIHEPAPSSLASGTRSAGRQATARCLRPRRSDERRLSVAAVHAAQADRALLARARSTTRSSGDRWASTGSSHPPLDRPAPRPSRRRRSRPGARAVARRPRAARPRGARAPRRRPARPRAAARPPRRSSSRTTSSLLERPGKPPAAEVPAVELLQEAGRLAFAQLADGLADEEDQLGGDLLAGRLGARPRRGSRAAPTGCPGRRGRSSPRRRPCRRAPVCAFARLVTSPQAITGTSTSSTSSAVSRWSAVPVYICFAERGCSVRVAAPASTSFGPTSRQVREPSCKPAAHLHRDGHVDRARRRPRRSAARARGRRAASRRRRSSSPSAPGSRS